MTILIDRKEAVLKKGTSFDYIMENRFFTGADSYTLSITFPLRGCPQNIEIFGHIYRKDNNLSRLTLDCEIHDRAFHKYGSISIVEISETEVKTQFLEGRSERNFYSDFDSIYINEIPMGSVHDEVILEYTHYLRSYDEIQQDSEEQGIGSGEGYVCLPWVNNTSGNLQNRMGALQYPGSYMYSDGDRDHPAKVVGMPYLLTILKKIFTHFGYTYDFSELENSQWRHIIICNALPHVWDISDMQAVLPHWTVTEFLEEVELFINGEFNVDDRGKFVSFSMNSNILSQMRIVKISTVIDEHQIEVTESDQSKNDSYIELRNLAYSECTHQLWKYYSCDWVITQLRKQTWLSYTSMMNTLRPLLDCTGSYDYSYYKRLHYCRAEDTYFVIKYYRSRNINGIVHKYLRMQPVNVFGKKTVSDEEGTQEDEMRIVPACIDHTDEYRGDALFIECGTLGSDSEDSEPEEDDQPQAVNTIIAGETDKKDEFFDRLYVAFWDGVVGRTWPLLPVPFIDKVYVNQDSELIESDYSMRLTGLKRPVSRRDSYEIDQNIKFTFKFLVTDGAIPDIRSIFLIHGKKYMAEKITATISAETGMSQLLKMTCYRIVE